MITFVKDRQLITNTVLALIKSDHNETDEHDAYVTWWTNFRSTGGFGLTVKGATAFEQAAIEYSEFDVSGWASLVSSFSDQVKMSSLLNRKMIVPYHLYHVGKKRSIRIYDSRISMMIALHGTVAAYVQTLPDRNKKDIT